MIIDRKYTGLPEGVSLNEMQEQLVPYMNTVDHLIVSAPTGSGKSMSLTMFGYKYIKQGKKIVYVGIMKALADQQRYVFDDPDHPWYGVKTVSITGDYKWTKELEQKVHEADIIVITPESLVSRLRHTENDKGSWLFDVGLFIFDEIHLVGSEGRGAMYETTIMETVRHCKEAQYIALSATIPNGHHFKAWFERITREETHLIVSEYRAVPAERYYIPYKKGSSTEESEKARLDIIKELILSKPDEQFLVVFWKKAFGVKFIEAMRKLNIPCEFHSANESRENRAIIENAFKKKIIRVLGCTTTLTTGLNLPARNVIITTVEAAGKDIDAYDIVQACGRAGRFGYDDKGFQYILLPEKRYDEHIERIENLPPIKSTMGVPHIIAEHFLGAVYTGLIYDKPSFKKWFKQTLLYVQIKNLNNLDQFLEHILDDMQKCGMLTIADNDHISITHRGKICSQLMLDPYHFADAIKNLSRLMTKDKWSDIDIARALGELSGYYSPYISAQDKRLIPKDVLKYAKQEYIKAVAVIFNRIKKQPVPSEFMNVNWQVYNDIDRLGEGLVRYATECQKWGDDVGRIQTMCYRVKTQCGESEAKMRMSQFKPSEIRKLMQLGLYTKDDIENNMTLAGNILDVKRIKELGIG